MPMPLCPAELLVIAGADAPSFAQAQFTSDVMALTPGHWQWSAWLDAQGRVRHFFLLLRAEPDSLLAWLPLGGAETMRDGLARYVFRAKVKLSVAADWALHASTSEEIGAPLAAQDVVAHAGGFAFRQPGDAGRIAWLAPVSSATSDEAALERWHADDVAAGLPLLAPALAGEFVPQALALERLDAIRFDKGCYPGQEVAARLHFRGGNKRDLRRVRVHGAAPEPGADLLDADGAKSGRILYSASVSAQASEALAVLPIETNRNDVLKLASDDAISVVII